MIEHLESLRDDFFCFPIDTLGLNLLKIGKKYSNKSPKPNIVNRDEL